MPAMVGTVAVSYRTLAPPAQGACGGADRRELELTSVRSSGDRRGDVPLAGASGRAEAGAGEEALSGELQLEQRGRKNQSKGRKSMTKEEGG